jgi:hypothetical protein
MSDSVRHIMVVASTANTGSGGAIPAHYVPARAHFSYRSPPLMTLNTWGDASLNRQMQRGLSHSVPRIHICAMS